MRQELKVQFLLVYNGQANQGYRVIVNFLVDKSLKILQIFPSLRLLRFLAPSPEIGLKDFSPPPVKINKVNRLESHQGAIHCSRECLKVDGLRGSWRLPKRGPKIQGDSEYDFH